MNRRPTETATLPPSYCQETLHIPQPVSDCVYWFMQFIKKIYLKNTTNNVIMSFHFLKNLNLLISGIPMIEQKLLNGHKFNTNLGRKYFRHMKFIKVGFF